MSRASVDAAPALVRAGLDPASALARELLGEGLAMAIGSRFVLFTVPTVTDAELARVHEALEGLLLGGLVPPAPRGLTTHPVRSEEPKMSRCGLVWWKGDEDPRRVERDPTCFFCSGMPRWWRGGPRPAARAREPTPMG